MLLTFYRQTGSDLSYRDAEPYIKYLKLKKQSSQNNPYAPPPKKSPKGNKEEIRRVHHTCVEDTHSKACAKCVAALEGEEGRGCPQTTPDDDGLRDCGWFCNDGDSERRMTPCVDRSCEPKRGAACEMKSNSAARGP